MKYLRKHLKYIFPLLILIMIVGLLLSRVHRPDSHTQEPEIHLSATEAKDHIGISAEVCGDIASARYLPQIGGDPTFLNFGEPDPNQLFTVIVWGENRYKWDKPPEQQYKNQHICVTGVIELHEGTPQIIVESPNQIEIQDQ